MTRPYPIPAIEIDANAYEDDDTGLVTIHPIIRAYTQATSLGTLALNQFEDLHVLRKAIDNFIITHDIQSPLPMEKESTPPQYTTLIGGYLTGSGYRPLTSGIPAPRHTTLRTSQEIIIDLADMADLTLNEVAACMIHLGYTTSCHEGRTGWLLAPAGN